MKPWLRIVVGSLILLAAGPEGADPGAEPAPHPLPWRSALVRCATGEFERQSALVLACDSLLEACPQTLAAIVRSACSRVPVIALVSDDDVRSRLEELLDTQGLPANRVYFASVPHDTPWIRDYGPTLLERTDGSTALLDAEYPADDRADDDRAPTRLASLLGVAAVQVPLQVDGGNLIVNGEGLCVVTTEILKGHDPDSKPAASTVRDVLRRQYGCQRIVFLEPLSGEDTGHADMFVTFTSKDTVVVGAYEAAAEPENAEILDRNAERLSHVVTARGHLNVVRVPMPPHDEDSGWRTYTNVIYANGALLVPVYPGVDGEGQKKALATYSRLLPGWTVVGVDSTVLTESGGGLHCISRNLPALSPLERLLPPCVAGTEEAADLSGETRRERDGDREHIGREVRFDDDTIRRHGLDASRG